MGDEADPRDEKAEQVAHYMKLGADPKQIQELLEISEDELRDLIRYRFSERLR